MFTSFSCRAGSIVAGCALLFIGVQPAQASISPSATNAGAWLAGQLTGGLIHNPNFGGFDDYGSSLDVLFALQEADTQGPKQDAIVSAMRKNLKSYIFNYPSSGPADGVWAGSAAKLLLGVQNAGKDGKDFGGVDLVSIVEATVSGSGTDKGRLMDQDIPDWSDPGKTVDYSNMFYQAYGLQGLAEAKSAKVDEVRDFLLAQQCGPGYFRMYPGPCVVDVDATAIAVRAMVAAKADGVAGLDGALTRATGWLKGQQHADGSFSGGASTPQANTNSTGLAASALALRGELPAARKAAAWTYRLQVTGASAAPLVKDAGAVALGPDQFAAGGKDGLTDATRAEWQRATSQAALGLIYLDPDTIGTVRVINKTTKPLIRTVRGTTVSKVVVTRAHSAGTLTDAEAKTAAGRAGQYVAEQLSDGDHVEVKEGADTFVDYDLTADAALALRLTGQQPAFADRTTDFLLNKNSIDAYAHGAPYEQKAAYGEALAKLIILAKTATKADQRTMSQLATELAGLQRADGSFTDRGKFAAEVHDTKRQALAALALRMAGNTGAADRAVDFLLAGQCADGGFDRQLGNGCATGDAQATGWALQAANAVAAADRPADARLDSVPSGWDNGRTKAMEAAVAWLHGLVRVDGSVAASTGASDLVASAVVAAGRRAVGLDSHATTVFFRAQQLKDGGLPVAAGGKNSNLAATVAVAPGLTAAGWLTSPRTGLRAAVSLPVATKPAVASKAATTQASTGITVPRPAAYAGAGALVLLLAALAAAKVLAGRRADA